MRITLKELRRFIREGVFSDNQNAAGYFDCGGISACHNGEVDAPGLGDNDGEDEKEDDMEKLMSLTQPGAHVRDMDPKRRSEA